VIGVQTPLGEQLLDVAVRFALSKRIRSGRKQPPVLVMAFPDDYDSLIEGKQHWHQVHYF
jgi:hypothetical protein